MSLRETGSTKITQLANKLKGLLTTHENKTGSSTQKGHVQAGGAPQGIGTTLQAGTDNGYYARADHVHTVEFDDVLNTPNALDVVDNLTTNDGSKPLSAKQGKWLNDNKAQLSHNHDTSYISNSTGSVTSNHIADGTIVNADIASNAAIAFSKLSISKANITGLGIPAQDTTYTAESTATNIKMNGTQSAGDSSTYARGNHVHPTDTSRAPTSHASTGTGYGVGTTANYGHNKIIDDATKSSLTNGESLSAHMGYILNNQDVEYVVSTHTSSTSTWTGICSKLRKLEAGTKIYYRLNQDPTTTDVTLNLTLADNTTTGAKNVYFGGTRLKNQYPKYAVIGMVFDGSNWIVINQYTNTNTTYSVATQSANGLMSSSDKTKLDGVATGANKTTIANNLTTTTAGSALDATQGKWLYDNTVKTSDSRLTDARKPKFNLIPANKTNNVSADLNTYRTGGFYYVDSDTNSQLVYHTPKSDGTSGPYTNNKSFFLLVETWGDGVGSYVKQTLTYYNTNETFVRTKTGGADTNANWKDWVQLDNNNQTSIISGDLNDYKTPGNWLIWAGDLANISNAPVSGGLFVRQIPNGFMQIICQYGADTKMWYRNFYAGNSTWTGWVQIYNSGTIPTASTSTAGIVKTTDSTSTTSSTIAASATAVKAAYDKGNHSHPYISTTGGSVGTSNLATDAVETAKIKNANVTLAKLNSDVYDTTPGGTAGSSKLITSGAVYDNTISRCDSNGGTAGYYKLLQIRIKGSYSDSSINFTINHRGYPSTNITILFQYYQKNTSSSSNPYYYKLNKIYYDGGTTATYIVQTVDNVSDATFEIITARTNNYDDVSISSVYTNHKRLNPNNLIITPINTFITSLPSGATQATLNPYYAPVNHASSGTGYGVATTSNYGHTKYGTTSGTACQGDDSRLSNTRTPTDGSVTTTKITNDAVTIDKVKFTDDIGGTNLLLGTQSFATGTNGSLTGEYYKDTAIKRYNNTSGTTYVDCSYSNMPPIGDFKAGDKYTLSFWAKGTGTIICYSYGNSGYLTSKPIKSNGGNSSGYGDGNCTFTLSSTWKRFYVTWELNPSGANSTLSVSKTLTIRTNKGADAYIAGVMFERGEIAHDWTISPLENNTNKIIAASGNTKDLNNYTTAGFYYNDSNAACSYISNLPAAGRAFFLLVESWGATNYTKQTVTHYDTNKTYTRIRNAGTWGTWREISADNNTTYTADNSTLELSGTQFKVKDNGITSAKIANGTIVNADISESAAISASKIAGFTLAFAAQTGKGVTVKTYTDGLSVYVTFEGTASVTTGSSSSPSSTTIVTLSNTAYAPIINTQVPARESAGGHRMKLNSSGTMQYLNDTSGTSFSVKGAFYYPLKSRLP